MKGMTIGTEGLKEIVTRFE